MKQKMDSIVHDIVTYANYYCKTDYEKALYVHDYLIKTCVYDEKTYEKYLQEDGDGSSLSYTAYGCICNHTANEWKSSKILYYTYNSGKLENGIVSFDFIASNGESCIVSFSQSMQ